MLLERFSSNATPRIFFVTATPPLHACDGSRLGAINPCLLMRFNENTLQKPTGRNNRHGQEDRGRGALPVPRLRGLLGADGGGYAGEQARGVARAADRLR